MKFVSHRGLLTGKNKELENKPNSIDNAILHGFDVEIDIRYIDGKFFLGHDIDQMIEIDFNFLLQRKDYLWIHTKNFEAFDYLFDFRDKLNYFWHTEEDFVLTSFGYPWIFPGKACLKNGIMVMPEYYMDYKQSHLLPVAGICSDHITEIRENYDSSGIHRSK